MTRSLACSCDEKCSVVRRDAPVCCFSPLCTVTLAQQWATLYCCSGSCDSPLSVSLVIHVGDVSSEEGDAGVVFWKASSYVPRFKSGRALAINAFCRYLEGWVLCFVPSWLDRLHGKPRDACHVLSQVGERSLTAKEGSLTRTMKSSFSDLCIKYEDVRNVDRMAAVQVCV